MDYVFLGKTLPFDRVSGRLLFTDNRLQLSDIAGKLFNGDVRGGADISLAKSDQQLSAPTSLWKGSIFRGWPISISNTKPGTAA